MIIHNMIDEICPFCRAVNQVPEALIKGSKLKCHTCQQWFSYSGGKTKPTVPELMRAGAATYEQRNRLYGDSYKRFGQVMEALFPDGIEPQSLADWNRLGLFNMIVSKIIRYAANMPTGGHSDSAHDLSVYASMLEELTEETKN